MAKMTLKLDTQEVLAVLEDKLNLAKAERLFYERDMVEYNLDMLKFEKSLTALVCVDVTYHGRERNGVYTIKGKGFTMYIDADAMGLKEPNQPKYPSLSTKELDDLKVAVDLLKMCKQPTISTSQLGDFSKFLS